MTSESMAFGYYARALRRAVLDVRVGGVGMTPQHRGCWILDQSPFAVFARPLGMLHPKP